MRLDELQKKQFVVGLKETERSLEKGEASYVFVASDCDDRISVPLLALCNEKAVPVTRDFTKKEIGAACGIKVKAAAAAVIG